MDSEGVLVDLELSETSFEGPSQLSFEDLVGNKLSPILPLCTEVNPFDSSQERISYIREIPAVTLSESYLSNSTPGTLFTPESSQTSEITSISKESPSVVENNCIPSDEDNSCEQNIPYSHTTTVNNSQINSYTDSKPGTSSECLNQQNIERIGDESKESSATKVIVSWEDQESSSQQENGKRKAGRRPRGYYKNLKPTRESQRKKKCPKIMTYEHFGKEKCSWNVKDKRIFLKALEKWGPDNIKAIHAEMPNKKESDIFNQIKMWKEFAHADLQKKLSTEVKRSEKAMVNCITKLDEWIQHFSAMEEDSTSKLFALSNVFLLISEYGNFPPPSECNDLDFRAMYRYIYCMLNGIPYYGVNQKTAQVLNNSISDMFALMREHNHVSNLQPHLYSSSLKVKPRCHTYGRPSNRGAAMLKNPNAIVNLPDINPLNIPPHVLSKPEIDEYEYDDGSDEDDDLIEMD